MVNQLSPILVEGAIGYIPVFDDMGKAMAASDKNKYSVKKMEIVNVKNTVAMKRNKLLNKIQNSKL